ncbi:type II secretion system protein [Thiomicrorhabdus indica]|uniref:type II secretion system protein n=1 Tax=Thiomicrorhabdus indica TaxID=2267253 RepID=UPI00102D6F13|nr:type II secretion system protein [Thiomicrorhabdus indica]
MFIKRFANKKLGTQKGMAMLEMVAALSVVALLMTSVLQMNETMSIKSSAALESDNLATFQNSAAQYFLNHRTGITQAMTDGTDANKYCQIHATGIDSATDELSGGVATFNTTLHTCAFDAYALKQRNLWPLELPPITSDHYVAIFRQIFTEGVDGILGTADDEPTNEVDMLVVLASFDGDQALIEADFEKSLETRKLLGATAGIVPGSDLVACNAGEACGSGWKLDLNEFIN